MNLGPGTELRSMGRQGAVASATAHTELEGTRILHPGSKRNSVLAQTSSPRKKQVARRPRVAEWRWSDPTVPLPEPCSCSLLRPGGLMRVSG